MTCAINLLPEAIGSTEDDPLAYVGRWFRVNETMPMPGVPVIALVVDGDWRRRLRAQYAAEKTLPLSDDCEDDNALYDEDTGEIWCSPGWYETNEFEDVHWRIDGTVVCWTPLPPEPDVSDFTD